MTQQRLNPPQTSVQPSVARGLATQRLCRPTCVPNLTWEKMD